MSHRPLATFFWTSLSMYSIKAAAFLRRLVGKPSQMPGLIQAPITSRCTLTLWISFDRDKHWPSLMMLASLMAI